jgi:hypothetical protein
VDPTLSAVQHFVTNPHQPRICVQKTVPDTKDRAGTEPINFGYSSVRHGGDQFDLVVRQLGVRITPSMAQHPRALTRLRSGCARWRFRAQGCARAAAATRGMARTADRCVGATLVGGEGRATGRVEAQHGGHHQKRTRCRHAALLARVRRLELCHRPQHGERSTVGAEVVVNRHDRAPLRDPARGGCRCRPRYRRMDPPHQD